MKKVNVIHILLGIFAVIILVITIIYISSSSGVNIAKQKKFEYDFSIPFDAITVWYLEPNTFDEISKEISIDKLNEKAKTYDICYLSDSEKTLSVNFYHNEFGRVTKKQNNIRVLDFSLDYDDLKCLLNQKNLEELFVNMNIKGGNVKNVGLLEILKNSCPLIIWVQVDSENYYIAVDSTDGLDSLISMLIEGKMTYNATLYTSDNVTELCESKK